MCSKRRKNDRSTTTELKNREKKCLDGVFISAVCLQCCFVALFLPFHSRSARRFFARRKLSYSPGALLRTFSFSSLRFRGLFIRFLRLFVAGFFLQRCIFNLVFVLHRTRRSDCDKRAKVPQSVSRLQVNKSSRILSLSRASNRSGFRDALDPIPISLFALTLTNARCDVSEFRAASRRPWQFAQVITEIIYYLLIMHKNGFCCEFHGQLSRAFGGAVAAAHMKADDP